MPENTAHATPQSDQTPDIPTIPAPTIDPKTLKEDSLRYLLKSLKTFSREDLKTIREKVDILIDRREKAERKADLQKAKDLLKKHNITPEELMKELS